MNLVRVGHRRIDALAIYEFARFGHGRHALFVEKKIDEGFGGVRMRRFVKQREVAGVAEKFAGADVIQRRAFEAVQIDVIDVADADRNFSRGDAFGGRAEGFH